MANKSVSVVVRGSFQGQHGNWGLNPAKQAGLTGVLRSLLRRENGVPGKEASANAARAISPPDRHRRVPVRRERYSNGE